MKLLFMSFKAAFQGMRVGLKERNMKIHAVAAAAVLIVAAFFDLTIAEYAVLILIIAAVLCAELINTAIERLTDIISPEYSQEAGTVKDIAAAAVLVCAVAAVAIAAIIFGGRIVQFFLAE